MSLKILLIDDDPDFLERSKQFWTEEDKEVEITTMDSGKSALGNIKQNEYDAIVADYRMPEINGLELLEELKDLNIDTPFVMITGKGNEDVAMEAINKKADRYIRKEANPKEQYKIIKDAIFEQSVKK